jgi:hypothetical protein
VPTWIEIFGILSGIASFYGAWVSWQQRRGAAAERAAAVRAADEARRLVGTFHAQRLLADCIFRCRRAQSCIPSELAVAADQLTEVISLLGRLSGEPVTRGRLTPSAWNRMREELIDLVKAIRGLGARVMPNQAQARASGTILYIIGEMERLSAEIPAAVGED